MNELETQIREFHDMVRKTLADGKTVKVRKGKAGRPSHVEGKERTLLYVASDETADRYGDIIRVKGWMLDNFGKAPVLIWSHNYDLPPIGSVKAWKAKDPKALMAEATYFERDVSEFSDTIYRLAEIGGIPGVSVGFSPVDVYDPSSDEEREKLGLGKWGFEYRSADLLELSQVSVPANPNAVGASYETPEDFARSLGAAIKADAGKAFSRDHAQTFVKQAGDWFAAAATPVLRDLSLLPSAPLVSVPAVIVPPPPVATITVSNSDGLSIAQGGVDIATEIGAAVKSACEQVTKAITESLTSEAFRKSLAEAVCKATAGSVEKVAPAPMPSPKTESQAVAAILNSGLSERLEKLSKSLKK